MGWRLLKSYFGLQVVHFRKGVYYVGTEAVPSAVAIALRGGQWKVDETVKPIPFGAPAASLGSDCWQGINRHNLPEGFRADAKYGSVVINQVLQAPDLPPEHQGPWMDVYTEEDGRFIRCYVTPEVHRAVESNDAFCAMTNKGEHYGRDAIAQTRCGRLVVPGLFGITPEALLERLERRLALKERRAQQEVEQLEDKLSKAVLRHGECVERKADLLMGYRVQGIMPGLVDYHPEVGLFSVRDGEGVKVEFQERTDRVPDRPSIEIRGWVDDIGASLAFPAAHVAWLLHHGQWPELDVIPADGNVDNLRIDNLKQVGGAYGEL